MRTHPANVSDEKGMPANTVSLFQAQSRDRPSGETKVSDSLSPIETTTLPRQQGCQQALRQPRRRWASLLIVDAVFVFSILPQPRASSELNPSRTSKRACTRRGPRGFGSERHAPLLPNPFSKSRHSVVRRRLTEGRVADLRTLRFM